MKIGPVVVSGRKSKPESGKPVDLHQGFQLPPVQGHIRVGAIDIRSVGLHLGGKLRETFLVFVLDHFFDLQQVHRRMFGILREIRRLLLR